VIIVCSRDTRHRILHRERRPLYSPYSSLLSPYEFPGLSVFTGIDLRKFGR